jgi:hypothetical protein
LGGKPDASQLMTAKSPATASMISLREDLSWQASTSAVSSHTLLWSPALAATTQRPRPIRLADHDGSMIQCQLGRRHQLGEIVSAFRHSYFYFREVFIIGSSRFCTITGS